MAVNPARDPIFKWNVAVIDITQGNPERKLLFARFVDKPVSGQDIPGLSHLKVREVWEPNAGVLVVTTEPK